MKLSIILPAKDEEELLPSVLKEIVSYLKKTGLSYELIVVENGSTDNTFKIAKDFSKENTRVRVERLEKPAYGEALIHGINKARGDYIVIFNVDFWDKKFIDITKIKLLGYDIVTGSKNLPGAVDNRPLARRLITRGYNFLLDFISLMRYKNKVKNIYESFVFRLMQFWGTYKGYNYGKSISKELKKQFYYPGSIK